MEVQLSKFFDKRGLNFMNLEVVAVRLAAQGISHYISLAGGIGYTRQSLQQYPSISADEGSDLAE